MATKIPVSKKKIVTTIPQPVKKQQKRPAHYNEQYRDLFTMRMKPVPKSFIEKISIELIEWAMSDPKALILRDFFYGKGIRIDTAGKWAKKHAILKEAMEDAKLIIGSRREKGAIEKDYDSGMIRAVMSNYDPEWEKLEVWRAELKQKQDEITQKSTIQWVLEKFPDSKLVPKKPEESDGDV